MAGTSSRPCVTWRLPARAEARKEGMDKKAKTPKKPKQVKPKGPRTSKTQ